jgi:adenine-specific DNA-methyltransferase
MSRLTELIRQAKEKDPALGAELEREYRTLAGRRAFGLNFERHRPEAVELPGRPVRRGDKVRILPPRGSSDRGDRRLWRITRIEMTGGERLAHLDLLSGGETTTEPAADLVVVAEFRDPIHPGLVSTGGVHRGGDKPAYTVINGENFHVLKALTWAHRGKIDAIYIDPPYNTGAKDWKYNNDYVEGDDLYRHSKWLAFMERRLLLAKELLNPEHSVLIVTIDEKEYLRLGLLLEQTFPEARIQMASAVINPKGATRSAAFGRTDEYLFFAMFGTAAPAPLPLDNEWKIAEDRRASGLRWAELLRSGSNTRRADRPNQFYPVFIRDTDDGPVFCSVGEPYYGDNRHDVLVPDGCVAVWPIRSNGSEGNWQLGAGALSTAIEAGYVRLGRWRAERTTIAYLKRGEQRKVEAGVFPVVGRRADTAVVVDESSYAPVFIPGTQWRISSHNAEQGGTNLLKQLIPERRFPFPKSLYAVEDALRFFVEENPHAIVLDFFAGSGTTAHAVMRLNRQDGGRRQCISVTNNEVSADEHRRLRESGLRPGDPEWEARGICDHITKPRIEAAITGQTPNGDPIKGDYKFTDEFPMADGFEENAEFFTLTYENPVAIGHNRAFERVAPLLWLRAGATGRRIEVTPEEGWDVADTYGVLVDLDHAAAYVTAIEKAEHVRLAYVVTDDDRRFQSVARQLPEGVEVVRLYESYLSNFRFTGAEP